MSDDISTDAQAVLRFWFGPSDDPAAVAEHGKALWWSGGPELDREIEARFGELVARAERKQLGAWAETPRGRLAHVLVCDQFPRNIYRGSARAFSLDPEAQRLCLEGIASAADQALAPQARVFLYMPLMHAEDLALQERAVELYSALAAEAPALDNVKFAVLHRDLIARFGRFPHRNKVLDREPTPEEREYLEQGGETFGQG